MDCTQTEWLSNEAYLRLFNRKVIENRIPLSGSLDLTRSCNLRCVHCYLGDAREAGKYHEKELSTSEWLTLIDEITDAGCLYLLITGGEPLLRADFTKIYSHAKKNGLFVTVFTNGTMITDRVLDLFRDLPPQVVEISLYGATASTCERITGVKGSYEKCLQGIRRLLDHGINLELKTVLITYNRHEFFDMKNMARDYGVKFRFDPAIFPRFNGDKTPMRLRVSTREAIEKEFSDDERLRKWREYFEKTRQLPAGDELYNCGAGVTSFHIDARGGLQPCLMITDLRYDLMGGSFLEGWNGVMPQIMDRKVEASFACNRCEKRTLCGFCPAFFRLENGAEDCCSEYLCAVGQGRFDKIKDVTSMEDGNANGTH